MTTGGDGKHPGGRPLKFKTVDELAGKIEDYFKECEREEDTRIFRHGEEFDWMNKEGKNEHRCKECRGLILDEYELPTRGCILANGEMKLKTTPTISGLAMHLDCETDTIRNYAEREEFFGPIRNAYLRVARIHEEELSRDKVPPAKTIFALSNFGWKNPQHIDHSLTVTKHPAAELAEGLLAGVASGPDADPPEPKQEPTTSAE